MSSLLILLFLLGSSLNHSSLFWTLVPANDFWTIISFPLLSGDEAVCAVWSVCGVSYSNRSQMLFTDSWVPEILSEILGGHTIFKVIISPSGCSIVGKICWGFSANKGSGIELPYTKRKKKEEKSWSHL